MNRRVFSFVAASLWFFLIPILPAGGDIVPDSDWVLAPLNPDYLNYLEDVAAGNDVPPLMPPLLQIDPDSLIIPDPPANSGDLPSAYDLRTLGRVTPAWGTGKNCGMCWTSAAMGSLESFLAPGEMRDFSESHMQLNWGINPVTCYMGATFEAATKYLAAWRGPVNETDFSPYARELGTSRPKVQKHVQNVLFLPNRQGPLDNTWIKLAVMHLGGVYSSISRSPWCSPAFNTYYNPVAGSIHAVTIVGWDDNFDRNKFCYNHPDATEDQKIPPGNGAFIAKDNSGPDEWEKGFFYVSYYDASIGTGMAVFTAEPLGNYNRIYQYDPLGFSDFFYPAAGSTYAANVYTASAEDYLVAVSFYNYDLSGKPIDYQVQVYLDPVDGPVNPSGPQAAVDFSPAFLGYYTVKLPQKIPLKKGQKFSVVVAGKQRDDIWGAMVPLERPSWDLKATANAGESYVRRDGEEWQDVTKLMVKEYGKDKLVPLTNTNVCIKAFTKPKVSAKAQITESNARSLIWTITNEGSTAAKVKPVLQLYRETRDGFQRFGKEEVGEYRLGRDGDRQNLKQGWVEVSPGGTINVFSRQGALDQADRVAYNFYTINAQDRLIQIADIWKYINNLINNPLNVVSTDPPSDGMVNFPGLNTIGITFDKDIKAGPSLQDISVSSSSEVKSILTVVSGSELLIYTATPLSSKELGGTQWTVQLPSDAVLDNQSGNQLSQDYSWSFMVTGVN